MQDGNRRTIWDYLDFTLLRIAKIGRSKLENPDGTEQFYNQFFNQNDVQVMTSGRDRRRVYRGEILRKAAWGRMSGEQVVVVDVGCGTGDNLLYIDRAGTRLIGLEYAEHTAKIAKTVLGDKADIHVASATLIPLANESCDLALCIEVLEHVEDDEKGVAEIARILRLGGCLILSLPYCHWFPAYRKLMGHFRHYTRSDVEQLLARHGLTIVEYLPNFPRWIRFANYCYVTARVCALGLRVVGIHRSPLEVRFPFSKERMVDKLFAWIEPVRKAEMDKKYSLLETSTFVVAKKIIPTTGQ